MTQLLFPWEDLITWYQKSGRHTLPWRDYSHDTADLLYRVWLSEILLQQTQVERVIPYFERILRVFPHIHTLAEASYEEFFPYYQGMGYYSRARNILKTAKIVSETYDGIFPPEKSLLIKLPGVGEYTSHAILAFGRGEPYLAWDTNLEKVFARYQNATKEQKLTEQEKEIIEKDFQDFIENYLPTERMKAENGGSGVETVGERGKKGESGKATSFSTPETFDTFGHKSIQRNTLVRAINNALMDFASLIDVKNPANIDWGSYPIRSGKFYETRGREEKIETKNTQVFPTPDATIMVTLHQDHKIYCSTNKQEYTPFILPPAGTRDTRKYVQDTFREKYNLELSVRPAHKKWLSEDGKPYIAVNAQVQTGDTSVFTTYTRHEVQNKL